MKRSSHKKQKITKGMPSAVLLSIAIHVSLFLLAGMLVVFTVVKKQDPKFVPPKAVERPKMKLRKPKVKVKKSTKPKPTKRIVTKVRRASMPDIQLPEMSGMTAGLGGGVDGFVMMPDLGEATVFGSGRSIGNDFEGTLYDFKRDRSGKPATVDSGVGGMFRIIGDFIQSGWKTSKLARFYKSPNKLYSPTIMIPTTESYFGPFAFNEPDMAAYEYMLLYKGQLVNKEGDEVQRIYDCSNGCARRYCGEEHNKRLVHRHYRPTQDSPCRQAFKQNGETGLSAARNPVDQVLGYGCIGIFDSGISRYVGSNNC